MIDLYYWTTPNGHKITLFLEETGMPYVLHGINIGKGDQFEPEFLKIAPNNRIPAMVDHAPTGGGAAISLFESGAILLYLAEKTGQFISQDTRERAEVLQWLFWQMGGLGPMAGQNHHFAVYAPEKIEYAINRYRNETKRLYGVMDRRLADRRYLAGDAYSIADMASYPWIVPHARQGQDLNDFPNLKRWFDDIAQRPATLRAYALVDQFNPPKEHDEQARKILFGAGSDTPNEVRSVGEQKDLHGEFKVPGGKLVVVDLQIAAGKLANVRVSGDFFLEPPEALDSINAALTGMSQDASEAALADAVTRALPADVEMFGFSADAIAHTVQRARLTSGTTV